MTLIYIAHLHAIKLNIMILQFSMILSKLSLHNHEELSEDVIFIRFYFSFRWHYNRIAPFL